MGLSTEQEIFEQIRSEESKIASLAEWRAFQSIWKSLFRRACQNSPFNPKFNAVHWAFDVNLLCTEIAYSLARMRAYACYYQSKVKEGENPAHVDCHVQYYADNAMSRIDSCRDKMALMVWSFYCAFNPESRVLDYEKVMSRLKGPVKHGLTIKNHEGFIEYLSTLRGKDFKRVEDYRHRKIHRREPRIEIYGPREHHDWPYMIPLTEKDEIAAWKKKHIKGPSDQWQVSSCTYKGVLYDKRPLEGRIWGYKEVHADIASCFIKLVKASTSCFDVLHTRKPLRNRTTKK